MQASYDAGVTDEFIEPAVIGADEGPRALGRRVIFVNFRPDRARQLTMAFSDAGFDGFDRGPDAAAPRADHHDPLQGRVARCR